MTSSSPMKTSDADLLTQGVLCLLKQGLQIEAGSTLLILHQEELSELAALISRIASHNNIRVDQRGFSRDEFRGKYPTAFSPDRLVEATPVAQGIVLLIEWSVQTTRGRLNLLRDLQARGRGWRIASMPGVKLEDLSLCVAPIKQIEERSFLVFAALARTQLAILRTGSPKGGEDKLLIPISEFCPNISTGAIGAGTWGNFPSGETFVVPNPYEAHGWMTLRGSFPNHVLGDHDWIRFEVLRGRLRFKSIKASTVALAKEFKQLFFDSHGKVAFKNANTIAELGIGTNPAVSNLTGNPIFDEKKLGTVHLGLGSNRQFKGPIDSEAHNDITCVGAALEASDITIVKDGQFVLSADRALPPLRRLGGPWQLSKSALRYSRRARYEFNDAQQTLYLTYSPYRGGGVRIPIDASGSIDIARSILEMIANRRSMACQTLVDRLTKRFDQDSIQAVLNGLVEFNLLEVVGKR